MLNCNFIFPISQLQFDKDISHLEFLLHLLSSLFLNKEVTHEICNLTAVFFETGAMLTPTKSQNGTNCGSGGLFQSYLTHS